MTEESITRSGASSRPAGRAWLAIVTLSCSGAVLIAACSSPAGHSAGKSPKPAAKSAASQSPAEPPAAKGKASGPVKAATCIHINSLRTSLSSLTDTKVTATSAGMLTTDLANIQRQMSALKGQNLGAFSAEEKQLMAALDKIHKDAAGLSAHPAMASKALGTDLAHLKTESGPMITEMKTVCHVT